MPTGETDHLLLAGLPGGRRRRLDQQVRVPARVVAQIEDALAGRPLVGVTQRQELPG
jgi:hypothetical protein